MDNDEICSQKGGLSSLYIPYLKLAVGNENSITIIIIMMIINLFKVGANITMYSKY